MFPIPLYSGHNIAVMGTEPWYLAGGVPLANALAAFKPKGAANIAASYVNIITPGVNDAADGVAPTFNTSYGWAFTGTQYLLVGAGALFTAAPCSMVAVFQRSGTSDETYTVMGAGKNASTSEDFTLNSRLFGWGHVILARTFSTTAANAAFGATYAADTWIVGAAVFTSATDRAIFQDGGGKVTNTTSKTPSGVNATTIGARVAAGTYGDKHKGKIAACAFYNIALSDAQVAAISTAMAAL